MEKKTIEEAAEWFANNYFDMHETNSYQELKKGFIKGAEWYAKNQSEQMYSDEEVKIYDKINKRIARQWFTDNDGNFYINSDPNGIQMSGKITIIQIGNNHPQYEIIKPKS
jgi:hypothetical protein